MLDPAATPLTSVQSVVAYNETEARSFLHYFLFTGDQPLTPNHLLSYGERARLMLALLVAQGCNFLILDEPINHLDIPSRARFEQALSGYPGTVLAVVAGMPSCSSNRDPVAGMAGMPRPSAERLRGLFALHTQALADAGVRYYHPLMEETTCPVVTANYVTLEDGTDFVIDHGAVAIAAITSCTNTSNPGVLLAAGRPE